MDKLEKGIQRTSQKETHRKAADDDDAFGGFHGTEFMVDKEVNLIKPIVDSLVNLSSEDESRTIRTKSFLRSCRLFLPVLDALGVAFKPAKSDVSGNVERLAKKEEEFENLFDILLDEKKSNAFAANTSCSKGLLWLKRFLEFVVVLVSKLAENRETETKEAASIAYAEKLKPFHGWVSSSAFSVVLQFPPARKGFVENLGGETVLETDGKELVEKFGPVLKRIDDFLTKEDLNDPSKV